jgi:hypothetical protein
MKLWKHIAQFNGKPNVWRKLKFAVIILLIFQQFVNAQAFQIDKPALSIDSLRKALPTLNDKESVNCLND